MRLEPPCKCSTAVTQAGGCFYWGHGGDTYGFITMSGYFPVLNASITLAMNQQNVAALDALQCELVNALYPMATYHPPADRALEYVWALVAAAALLFACAAVCACCNHEKGCGGRAGHPLDGPINR